MSQQTRRNFLQLSAAAMAAACARPSVSQIGGSFRIVHDGNVVTVPAPGYKFEFLLDMGRARVLAADGKRVITSFSLQPAVTVIGAGETSPLKLASGTLAAPKLDVNAVTLRWKDVGGKGSLRMRYRFDADAFWIEPAVFSHPDEMDVETFVMFDHERGAMQSTHFVFPGITENGSISPVQESRIRQHQRISLGHSGSHAVSQPFQQWALPSHYFLGLTGSTDEQGTRDRWSRGHRSPFFCCGFADMPAADPFVDLYGGYSALLFDYASSLWQHARTPGELKLGATLCFAFGDDILSAVSSYYAQLLNVGIIERKRNSAAKNATALAPQFCTWGVQISRGKGTKNLDQDFLETVYGEMKTNGMQAQTFSIDDKWEGVYGNLTHDEKRFPTFVKFLDRVRGEGHKVGIWTAFMRCQTPSELGLTEAQMLRGANGKPLRIGAKPGYFIMDTTQPAVAKVLADLARKFMRTYKPDLVKIDFGYELPSMREGAPKDMRFAGERLFAQALDVVVPALREVNPDVCLMYYQLSPLFAKYFDLHGTDDLYTNSGDYDIEANRRIFFASPLTQLGVSIYGSSGYDWESAPAIWFDSVAAGTIGSLNDFVCDEYGESATPERIALYNGIAHTVRSATVATIAPYPRPRAESATRGAHGHSWARLEKNKVVLLAHRPLEIANGDNPMSCADGARGEANVPDDDARRFARMIASNVAVIVASKTADGVASADRLAVVALGEGTVTLTRRWGTRATVVTHLFGGSTVQHNVTFTSGKLRLTFTSHMNNKPVEWHEVHIW